VKYHKLLVNCKKVAGLGGKPADVTVVRVQGDIYIVARNVALQEGAKIKQSNPSVQMCHSDPQEVERKQPSMGQ
jgi:hypothetical protein